MTSAVPGDGTYNEALDRISRMIRDDEEALAEIREMSDSSFREWLDNLATRVAAQLGLSAAKVKAYFADIRDIARNAVDEFKSSYRDAYEQSRRVKRRES